jgi:hypothetical protein
MGECGNTRKERWGIGHWIVAALVCYLVPFLVVLLDDYTLHWSWSLGPEFGRIFYAVYGPLIDLVNFLDPI